jgi:hypothetical protein
MSIERWTCLYQTLTASRANSGPTSPSNIQYGSSYALTMGVNSYAGSYGCTELLSTTSYGSS